MGLESHFRRMSKLVAHPVGTFGEAGCLHLLSNSFLY